jgi:acetyltransferase-like isoleucine patch superfamily enzyme
MIDGRWTRAMAGIASKLWTARLRYNAWRSGGNLEIDRSLRLRTRVIFRGRGTLVVAPGVVLGDRDAGCPGQPILLSPRHEESRIVVGRQSRLSNGVEITSVQQIELGEGCLVGSAVRIVDSDFHGVHPRDRHGPGRSAGVEIEDNVWIGMGAMVLKGVHIGTGAVVGAGSVVRKDVPAQTIVAGNPARVIASAAVTNEKGSGVSASR